MLTRRELLTASAGTGVCLGLGLPASAATGAQQPILRAIPSTGEMLPVIGIGANRWLVDNAETKARLGTTLITFSKLGGRVIDTAPAYRSSETALGQLIAEHDIRDTFFIATKVDRADADDGILRMEDSLKKFQTDRLDLMQVHSLRGADSQMTNLLNWKEAGRIRYLGLTTSRADQFAEMEELMNRYPVDFVQLNYSIIDQRAEERLLPLAQDKQIAVMVNLPFQRGRLFKAAGDKALPAWSTEFDCESWAQFFLKFVVAHPAVTCTIPGMTRPEHVRDNMGAAYGRLPDADQLVRMVKLFKGA
jgi:aryl-alcohol dehydrogenase-like predicted oxidoreductase